jgi:exodeoxyribonuclease VII large subunit
MVQPQLFRPSSYSVSEITLYLSKLFETDELLQNVWISGEISNLSRPSSGHVYFTLKDTNSAIKCVIWRTAAFRLPPGLQVGSQVEAHGAVSVYERDGAYQLYVDTIRMRGEGELFQEFIRLKARMEAEGYFDEDRKRPLPPLPQIIGIVTSPTGAALQDILNTLSRRYRLAEIIIAPAAVQGVEAPGEIVRGIQRLNREIHPDVILVARGGGSMEDLWAFNDENVVMAIAESESPIITGIGHETDFTLADFAADVRAPTPTGAAVMAVPSSEDLELDIEETIRNISRMTLEMVETEKYMLEQTRKRMIRESPLRRVERDRQMVDGFSNRLELGITHRFAILKEQFKNLGTSLSVLNPRSILERGYALVRLEDGNIVKSTGQLAKGNLIYTQFGHGSATSRVESTRLD